MQARRRTLQRSQTLMRTGMKRPAAQKPAAAVKKVKARTVSDFRLVKQPKAVVRPAANLAEREARAKVVKQSKLVRKFNTSDMIPAARPVTPKVQPLPVQPMPMQHQPLKLKPPHSAAESLIEKGLRQAQSHHQAPVKKPRTKKRGKLASVMAVSLAILLLGGFITYQNIPNISMRYAAARSGVSATLPGYAPSGFALNNHIQYNPGQITVSFSSNTDDRSFSITQRESNWNSDTLMSNYVATSGEPVQKYEDKGRTIFLYGDSNATWVNAGVWYDIKGNSQLNSDQLIRIATSM